MRVLYVASAVEVGGTSGGATHIEEVACGLRSLGHEVLVLARTTPGGLALPGGRLQCGAPFRPLQPRKELALLGYRQISRAFYRFRPHAVMERFYNLAGAGVLLAHRHDVPALLEVNAPMTDPPGSTKSRLDTFLLGSMRRWAVHQALWSSAIVTPLHTTVPPRVPRRLVYELPWGANVDQFSSEVGVRDKRQLDSLRAEIGLDPTLPMATFLGSFREWHGVMHFVRAAKLLLDRSAPVQFLTVGGGPELETARREVESWNLPKKRFFFTGPQSHERVPHLLALSDIGVAPFDLASYAPLRHFGFYWSPLKVFEYMAMSLPTVTIDVDPLNGIVRSDLEGLLYPPGDIDTLAAAIDKLAREPSLRQRMGASARERVVSSYSWAAHCKSLDALLKAMTLSPTGPQEISGARN